MKPNSQRAKNAINLLYVVMGASVITAAGGIVSMLLLQNTILSPGNMNVSLQSIMIIGLVVALFSLVYMVAYILCMVFFIQWFRRAYFNLHNLVPSTRLSYSEGWAAGAWFIPIFNFFAPFQIASDLFSKTEDLLVKHELMERKPHYHQVKGWWWGLWLASGLIGGISRNGVSNFNFDFMMSTILSILVIATTIASGFLAIRMIKNYSKMEELLRLLPAEHRGGTAIHLTNDDLLDTGI